MRTIIRSIVDKDSFFEIGPYWGNTMVVGFGRFHGRPMGIIANDPMHNAGALDTPGSQKYSQHVKLCDVFGLPIVQLVDIPGFAVGTVAERSGVMRHGLDVFKTLYTTTVPIFTIVTRRSYGIGGAIMVGGRIPSIRVAW